MRGLLSVLIAVALPATAAAEGVERRLYPDRVEASSFLWNDWNRFQENYHPNYIADDDPKTAWTEGADGAGEGEWLRVHLTELEGATRLRLRVRNGYHKSKRLFTRNARAKSVTVKLLPSGREHTIALTDDMKWQEVVVDQPAGKLDGFELRFGEVFKGTHYEDLVVSDVQVFVTATTPDNPRFEKTKRSRLLEWKSRRVKAARAFKKAAGKALPIASQYRAENLGPEVAQPKCKKAGPFCRARAVVAAAKAAWPEHAEALGAADVVLGGGLASWKPARVSPIDKRPIPEVDGARLSEPYTSQWVDEARFDLLLGGAVGYLRADYLKRVYDDTDAVSWEQAVAAEAKGCRAFEKVGTYVWTPAIESKAEAPSRVRTLFVVGCSTYEERDGEYAVANWQLLMYGENGRLELMVGPETVTRFTWSGDTVASVERLSTGAPRAVFRAAEPAAAN